MGIIDSKITLSNKVNKMKRKYYDMIRRCYNIKAPNYRFYGGRGITVSSEWLQSFDVFYNDMYCENCENLQIDRIDNNKGYSKENCRMVTSKENCRNTSRVYQVIVYRHDRFFKKFNTAAEAAEVLNIDRGNINNVIAGRRKYAGGYSFKRA